MGSPTSMAVRVGSNGRPSSTLEHDGVLCVIDDAPVAAVARVAARLGVQDQVAIVGLEALALPG